jgi:hypothetical protein
MENGTHSTTTVGEHISKEHVSRNWEMEPGRETFSYSGVNFRLLCQTPVYTYIET